MIEYILSASACAGVVGYLAGHWSGERKSVASAIKDAVADALRWKLRYQLAARERDEAERFVTEHVEHIANLKARIRVAKACVTPHANSTVKRMLRALDGNLVLVSDRTKQLREELKAVSNG